MKTSDRIRALIHERGISVRELSRRIGVSHVTIGKWVNDDFQPRGENLEALADFFSVTPAYIMYGEPGVAGKQTIEVSEDEVSIPVIDVRASCGFGIISETVRLVRMFRATREWLASRLLTRANISSLHIVTADGDSMEPGISHGDFVFVDTSQTTINADALFAIQYAGSIFIKRVMTQATGGVTLISDNKHYPEQVIDDASNLQVVGRVVLIFNVREP